MENRKASSITELIKKIEVVEKYEMFLIGFFTGGGISNDIIISNSTLFFRKCNLITGIHRNFRNYRNSDVFHNK